MQILNKSCKVLDTIYCIDNIRKMNSDIIIMFLVFDEWFRRHLRPFDANLFKD